MNPLSIGLGLAGLVSGIGANQRANSEAGRQRKAQQALLKRQLELFDMMMNAAKGANFDPDGQIAQLEKDTAKYEARDAGNFAGAQRIAGYQPGDSATEKGLNAVKLNYRDYLDLARVAIRRQSIFDKLNAFGAVRGDSLNMGIGVAGQNAANAQNQANANSPANLIGSLMPFFGRENQTPDPPGGGTGGNGSTYGWQSPVMATGGRGTNEITGGAAPRPTGFNVGAETMRRLFGPKRGFPNIPAYGAGSRY